MRRSTTIAAPVLAAAGLLAMSGYEPQHLAGVLQNVSGFVTEQIGAVA